VIPLQPALDATLRRRRIGRLRQIGQIDVAQ
jgi:hypothetical protein